MKKVIGDTDIIKLIYDENRLVRFAEMLLGLFLGALAFNLFFLPNDFVFGGISGLSIVVTKYYDILPSVFIFLVDLVLLVFSHFLLGKKQTAGSLLGTLLYPLLVYLTTDLALWLNFSISDMLLSAIVGGVLYGFGSGLVFRAGYSMGGTDVIKQILFKYAKISMGNSTIIVDGLVVLTGVIAFGWTKFMYAILILYISGVLTDKVLLGISDKKAFYIVTSKQDEISDFIFNELHHSVTILDAKGGYSNTKNPVLFTVIPTKEYFQFKQGINLIDDKAFWTALDAYEVIGGE